MSHEKIEEILESAELKAITNTERKLHFFLRRLHVRMDASELWATRQTVISIVHTRQKLMQGKYIVHL